MRPRSFIKSFREQENCSHSLDIYFVEDIACPERTKNTFPVISFQLKDTKNITLRQRGYS